MSIGIITQEVINSQGRLVIYHKQGGFQVGLIHPSQRLEVLQDGVVLNTRSSRSAAATGGARRRCTNATG